MNARELVAMLATVALCESCAMTGLVAEADELVKLAKSNELAAPKADPEAQQRAKELAHMAEVVLESAKKLQASEDERLAREGAASSVPCSALHPAQFTHVSIKLERSSLAPVYVPDKIDKDGRCTTRHDSDEGRFAISERGEIVVRFDSLIPGAAAGSLLVTGRIVTNQASREIEIPGYRVLGKSETPQQVISAQQKLSIKSSIDTVVECAAAGCDRTTVVPLANLKVDDNSILKAYVDAATGSKATAVEANTMQLLKDSAKESVDKLPASWSDVRIQPKELDAREGEVIELRVRHSIEGQVVEPTWTLRFVVEKTGIYVHVSPVLSLIWSHGFLPDAQLRGAQGLLAPGVEFTIDWFSGRYGHPFSRVVGFLFSGVGLGVDYLDFDSRQAVELGFKVNIQLFRGIISFGVGYNLGPQEPRLTDRALYYSIGIGIDKVLDRAQRVASFFAQ